MKSRKKSFLKRLFYFSLIFSLIIALGATFAAYTLALKPNINNKKAISVYIHSDWNYDSLMRDIQKKHILKHLRTFNFLASVRHLPKNIHPGRYILTRKMGNWHIINKLRSGKQDPVRVTFNNIRDKKELAGIISKQIEADSVSILNRLEDNNFVNQYGFNTDNVLCMFLPNTYEFYWNTSSDDFFKKMGNAYKKFWTPERILKAKDINLSQSEVSILASIVKAEQSAHPKEWKRIAGLYINRLKKGVPLQSDPTIIFAIGDYTIRRVLNKQKEIPSPYNTYKHVGLPPGPIDLPPVAAIKAVLNYEQNDFIYMCAKADLSGYHHFSKTLRQHNRYAQKYHTALNQQGVVR